MAAYDSKRTLAGSSSEPVANEWAARHRLLMHVRIFLLALAFCASPALADHMGPSSVGGGGGLNVFAPDTLDAGHGSFGLRVSYTRPERRSNSQLEALAADNISAHNTDDNLNASAGVAYGITHHLTLSAELPYVRRANLREGKSASAVARLGTVAGLGDVNLIAKYRLTEGDAFGFALLGGVKLPTGGTHKRSAAGDRLETEHQPGAGSWDPLMGVSAATIVGRLRLAVSALYQFSTTGAQATRLGDRLQGGIALSRSFDRREHEQSDAGHHHHHGDELDEHSDDPAHSSWGAFVELGGEWEGRQRIGSEVEEQSGGKWVYAAPGLRFSAASGWSVNTAIALPLWQHIRASHPHNRYRLLLSLGRSF